MAEHKCRDHFPKPRRWRLTQVRQCPECGLLYACQMWGILAPTPMWLQAGAINPTAADQTDDQGDDETARSRPRSAEQGDAGKNYHREVSKPSAGDSEGDA